MAERSVKRLRLNTWTLEEERAICLQLEQAEHENRVKAEIQELDETIFESLESLQPLQHTAPLALCAFDILRLVLTRVSTLDLSSCARVCKQWERVISTDPSLVWKRAGAFVFRHGHSNIVIDKIHHPFT